MFIRKLRKKKKPSRTVLFLAKVADWGAGAFIISCLLFIVVDSVYLVVNYGPALLRRFTPVMDEGSTRMSEDEDKITLKNKKTNKTIIILKGSPDGGDDD